MSDLTDLQIPVFTNINDAPVAPTTTKGSNGSYMVNQFNQLINVLEERFSTDGGVATGLWNFQCPSSTDNSAIELYYLNTSDYSLRTNSQTYLGDGNLIATYNNGSGFTPGEIILFSNHVESLGIGYYFWLFKLSTGTYKNDSWSISVTSTPKGASRPLGGLLEIVVRDTAGLDHTLTRIEPLFIQQPNANCGIELKDVEFIGG